MNVGHPSSHSIDQEEKADYNEVEKNEVEKKDKKKKRKSLDLAHVLGPLSIAGHPRVVMLTR